MYIIIFICYALVYLFFQAHGIPAGDSGDLVTAAVTLGIAHPPGYPLYIVLGWILNHVPLFTPAWRVGLLSSIPHVLTLFFIGSIVQKITRSRMAGIFASCVLFGNYIYFLYSITPEVFALLDMFVVLVTWLIVSYLKDHRVFYIYWLSFVFGLSLTHHHLILFTVPAILYILYKKRYTHTLNWHYLITAFIVGLIPYLYILYPPYGNSMIVWNPATTVQNAVKLITRADYGTFQSAIVYGQLPIQRLLNIQTYMQYISMDFLWLGILLAIIGSIRLWKRHRSIGILILLMIICIGPLFYFYASFPLSYRFSLGTLERFLLPSYCLISICIGVGYGGLIQLLRQRTKQWRFGPILTSALGLLLFLYPLKLTMATMQKTYGYNADKTAEYVGEDILTSLPKDSIFLADRDTVLFTSEYVRYARNIRTDIILLQGFKLYFPEQHDIIHSRYPTLHLPDKTARDLVTDFILKNIKYHRIFSYKKYAVPDTYIWQPFGLVYEVVLKEHAPSFDDLQRNQQVIWERMHDPSRGILSTYNHLILSDVRDIYTTARMEYGKTLLFANKYQEAIEELNEAKGYGGDATMAQTYMYSGIAHMLLQQCDLAISDIMTSKQMTLTPMPELNYYLGVTYRDCVKNTQKATEYFTLFESSQKTEDIPLQSLE